MQNVSKRTILWIVPIIIIAIFWYFYGPKDEITDNEYISYIKQAKVNDTSETYGEAFANFCKEDKWVYFKTQKEQHVVEFKGTCPNDEGTELVNLQFIVENNQTGYELNVLLLDNVQQPNEQRDLYLNELVSL